MNLILCSGVPASGKSFFARQLSKTLDTPYISKDEIQVELFNRYGFRSHKEKLELVRQADNLMYAEIKQSIFDNKDLIVDKFFKEYCSLDNILSQHKANVISFYLFGSPGVLAERYNRRIESGEREKPLYIENVYPVVEGITKYHPKMTARRIEEIESSVVIKTYGKTFMRIDTSDLQKEYLSQALIFIKQHVEAR